MLTEEQVETAYLEFVLDSQELCRDCLCVSECVCIGLMANGWDRETRKVHYSPLWICWQCLGKRESF